MKKITLLFTSIVCMFLLLFNGVVYASAGYGAGAGGLSVWSTRSYAPHLMIPSLYDFNQLAAATTYTEEFDVAGTCTMTTATTYGPMYSTTNANAVNRTAVIYPASQLFGIAGQDLTAVYFKKAGTSDPVGTPHFKLYLKETSNLDFGVGAWTWDIAGATLVYDSDPTADISNGAGWKKFANSSKFVYSGTKNLMVLMEYVNGGNTNTISWEYEYNAPCVNTSNNTTTKYNNNTTGVLATSLASTEYRRPHIKFDYGVDCASVKDIQVSAITATSATVSWTKGGTETAWEYAVQPAGQGIPTTFTAVTAATATVSNLSPATSYEVYVRSDCGATDGKSVWKMASFGTTCGTITSSLWWEGFNTGSGGLPCWTIIDGNADSTGPTGSNIWKTTTVNYEGTHSMYFYGAQSDAKKLPHNDWLISPPVKMQASKQYRLRYHYRTTSTASYNYQFSVLMSTTGSDNTNKFTDTIVAKKDYTPSTVWEEGYVIIDGVNADVNIAWHVTSTTQYTYIYLDNVFIEEVVGCPEPMDIGVKEVKDTQATLFWTDNFGATSWEYYVQEKGDGKPSATAKGVATTTKEVTATKDDSGANLVQNTEYEYYVRTKCTGGGESIWQGPFVFRTACTPITLVTDFWEGFNSDSATIDCWTIVDNNKDATSTTSGIWHTIGAATGVNEPYEGDLTMKMYGSSTTAPHDDWLISPALKVDSTKIYRLTYQYRTFYSNATDFQVKISSNGVDLSSFNKTLLTKENYVNVQWTEEQLFISGITGDINIAWVNNTKSGATYFFIDEVTFGEVSCADATNLSVTDVESDEVTLVWDDEINTSWEYYVQDVDEGIPGAAGTPTNTTEVTVDKTEAGASLEDNTDYEYYVRAKCPNGQFGDWIGPFVFTTDCAIITRLPFTETFDTTSQSVDCWTVIDKNNNGTTTNNQFLLSTTTPNSGSHCMRFYGTTGQHDDWLVSPGIQMDSTKIYQLTYYFKTNSSTSYSPEFEVLLSNEGLDTSKFTTVIQSKQMVRTNDYIKQTVFITGVQGESYIAWHVTSSGYTYLYVDDVNILEVDCLGPEDDITIEDIKKDEATFSWNDDNNQNWQYAVQPAGNNPPVTGRPVLPANVKEVTVTATSGPGGANLLPNTEYEFYVRSTCGAGKYSGWIGPVLFRTLCDTQALPFWEGFNTDSGTLDCWTIVDANGDSTGPTNNTWRSTTINHEGSHSMYFYGYQSDEKKRPHDDWLISPAFAFDATKVYEVRYHYRTTTTTSYDYEFEVLLSDSGIDTDKFTTQVVPRRKYAPSTVWEEQIAYVSGVGTGAHLAWRVRAETTGTYLYIDNIFVREVSCPQPIDLDAKDLKQTEVTLTWDDKFGSDWEYYVVKAGGPAPVANGTPTKNKEEKITQDSNGNVLTHTTEYEYYVRTICDSATGEYSAWSGPFLFRTACGVFDTPFWEGFNGTSVSLQCWSVVDGNGDATTSNNVWRTSTTRYEGSHSAYFYGTQSDADKRPHDDWLLSPQIKFEAGKKYRLKYHYRTNTSSSSTYEYEFEVLLSTTGMDNTSKYNQTVVPKKKYTPSADWVEEYLFIDGVNADVSLAWHVTSNSQYAYLYVDNVFVEEVTGCPEPLPNTLGTKDEDSNKVTLFWEDTFGATAWEYYIQEEGGITPIGKGIATTTKESVATLDGKGQALTPNTDYEFYVRTDCGDGTFSIWQGPFKFTTICGSYSIPFVEGFNTLEKTYRCWTIIDGNGDATSPTGSNIWRVYNIAAGVFEGDQAMYFNGTGSRTHDDWLISPTITMTPGSYVLKYHYRSTTSNNNEFEVLLSSQGADTTKFSTVILPSKVYKNGVYEEEVRFFNGVAGDINLAWHVKSVGATSIYLDKITLKKVDTCPEPYYVKVTGQTATTIDLEWQQDGGVTEWEVLVVDYGEDETATPVLRANVTGTPKTTLTGLPGGKAFTIFVRAKCADGTSNSDWATSIDWGTAAGGNNTCSGALTIPVNAGLECEETISGSLIGLVDESTIATPGCSSSLKKDAWFEFTASYETHMLKISDWKHLSGTSLSSISGAIYDQPCGSITATALSCFTLSNTTEGSRAAFNDLVPGRKYYIRLGVGSTITIDHLFNLCITSPDYLFVSAKDDMYTAEELVKDVLVNSNCDLVSNVRYQVGDGSPATQSVNTLGYFKRNRSDFPFDEGIVLSTGEVQYVAGPFRGGGTAPGGNSNGRGNNPHRWVGDKDLNDAIANAGGSTVSTTMRVTQIEFDFVPVKDSIHFEYLFGSNSHDASCTTSQCNNGAMFAAWLIDLTTGVGVNLAKVPGTELPIALNTIRNATWSGKPCTDENPEYYWKHFNNNIHDPLEAAVDYVGITTGMKSQMVYVVPGRKYHIKLAVMDFCSTNAHTSAVFFNAGSFDLGDLDLGADLLVEDGNALCGGECVTINSGLGDEDSVEISWYKDGVLIVGATEANYEACESGVYKVVGKFPAINCEVMGEKVIEIFPPISKVVHKPEAVQVCANSLVPIILDLDSQEDEMFINVDRDDYGTLYYLELADAEQGSDNFIDPEFAFDPKDGSRIVYIRIVDERTQCSEVFEMTIAVANGDTPSKPDDVEVCSSYIFPELKDNQFYYTGSAATGVEYKAGDILDIVGEHIIYILQLNGDEGCYEEVQHIVSITGDVYADVFSDATRDCKLFILEPLSDGSKYFTESGGPHGKGMELLPGTVVRPIPGLGSGDSRTIYVYASSEDGLCVDESSFTVKFEDCPIQKGISPNGDGHNDYFDLTPHGVMDLKIYNRYGTEVYSYGMGYTNEWMGQDKNGNALPDGTYYYVVISNGKVRTGWVQINR